MQRCVVACTKLAGFTALLARSAALVGFVVMQIEEECGYHVSPHSISLITSWHAAIGITGSRHQLCKADFDLDESMRVGRGGGVECVLLSGFVCSADEGIHPAN